MLCAERIARKNSWKGTKVSYRFRLYENCGCKNSLITLNSGVFIMKIIGRLLLGTIVLGSAFASSAAPAVPPFKYWLLALETCTWPGSRIVGASGEELGMHCPLARSSVARCAAERGEIGIIDSKAVCRISNTPPTNGQRHSKWGDGTKSNLLPPMGNISSRRELPPGGLGGPPPYNPTDEEATRFQPWKPSPTKPPIL